METILARYVELARQNIARTHPTGRVSDRQLSQHLNLNPAAINQWRKRQTYPSDDVMLKLAYFAEVNPAQALMDLNYMRSTGNARECYSILARVLSRQPSFKIEDGETIATSPEILTKRLKVTAIGMAIGFCAMISAPSTAIAALSPVTSHDGIVYIMGNTIRRMLRFFRYFNTYVTRLTGKISHDIRSYSGAPAPAQQRFTLA